jgi:heme ABC exporter ATP-binding subunit CcmA
LDGFMGAAVHFRSVVALLGRFPALAGVDLDVAEGEVVLVEGPNGAGKSSLLRACAGLLPVTAGEASVLGHDLRHGRREVRRQVGMLGHVTALYDDLTSLENGRFAVAAAQGDRAGVEPALARAGIAGRLAGTPVVRLSEGQRRRVALAILIARSPRLWLLDEPHAGLDAEARDLLDATVRRAVAAGATVVFASHELDRAHELADRVVVVDAGRTSAGAPTVAAETC